MKRFSQLTHHALAIRGGLQSSVKDRPRLSPCCRHCAQAKTASGLIPPTRIQTVAEQRHPMTVLPAWRGGGEVCFRALRRIFDRLPNASLSLLMLFLALASPARASIETFSIDSAHSFANWELRHIVARVSGTFHDIKGSVLVDMNNLANSSVNATISIYSLNSSHLRRDVHTLSEEFLDARNHPEMKFHSTGIVPHAADKGTLTGLLTLRGVTKPVTLAYQILGFGPDPWGGMRAGFKASTQLKRSDFGITRFTPNGPVGNEVDITLLIQGIKIGIDGKPWNAKAAAEEKARVTSYPLPILAEPPIVALPTASPDADSAHEPVGLASAAIPAAQTVPAATPKTPAQPALSAITTTSTDKPEPGSEDQLRKKLKGLFK